MDQWGACKVLAWMSEYPDRIKSTIPIATAAYHTSQNIAFHEVGQQAVMADPKWHEGKYFEHNTSLKKVYQ